MAEPAESRVTFPHVAASAGRPHRLGGPLRGIVLKILSVCSFVVMATLLKATGTMPAGELVFFRCAFALLPVCAYLLWRKQLRSALRTSNIGGHIVRAVIGTTSMGLGFFALTRLPLPESTAINYAAPLLIVVFSAILLKERVHGFRWTAVIVGLVGVLIVLWPRLTVFTGGAAMDRELTIGAIACLGAAVMSAFAMMQVRKLVQTERTEAIVVYFFISASILALLTVPLGWDWPTGQQWLLLIGAGFAGGIGQLLLTSCYRYADMSVIAPFEYVSLILTIVIGYAVFAEAPTMAMILGALIIVGSGIAVILREHYLGLDRRGAREANTP